MTAVLTQGSLALGLATLGCMTQLRWSWCVAVLSGGRDRQSDKEGQGAVTMRRKVSKTHETPP